MSTAPAPLFRDPIHDGAADPTIIWNQAERSWWLFYTNRRANLGAPGFAWVHGTDIGIASSVDGGRTWLYRGIVEGLAFARGRNTYWAPEIIEHEGQYHMYVSYVPGVPNHWTGDRYLLHYTSTNLWDWHFVAKLNLHHADVLVQGDQAYIFYFTHPGEADKDKEISPRVMPYSYRRTSLQVAALGVQAGQLMCDRDAAFDFVLNPPI